MLGSGKVYGGARCLAEAHHDLLQVCSQHSAKGKMFMTETEGRALVISNDCPRQRLHGDFENAPGVGEMENSSKDAEDEEQRAGYLATVCEGTVMRLWTCEGSHPSKCNVSQNRVKELGRLSVVRLAKMPRYSGFVGSRRTLSPTLIGTPSTLSRLRAMGIWRVLRQ